VKFPIALTRAAGLCCVAIAAPALALAALPLALGVALLSTAWLYDVPPPKPWRTPPRRF